MEAIKKLKRNKKETYILCKRSPADKVLFTIVFIIFCLQSLTLLFPIVWMFVSSLKTTDEYIFENAFALPEVLQWGNYSEAFVKLKAGKTNFAGMVFNSIWTTGVSTILAIIVPATTGYVFSKYRFRGRDAMYSIFIAAMMIPLVGTTAASLKFFQTIKLYDSPLFLIYCGIDGFGSSFLIYYGFFKSVSWAYAEAVQIDGGGPFTIFFKIMLPQAAPIMFTFAITNGIVAWNNYQLMLMYLPSYPTLASGLFTYKQTLHSTGEYTVYYAGLVISMIPAVAIFSIFSNRIMGSISIGGLKG